MGATTQYSSWTAPPVVVEALRSGRQRGAYVHAVCPYCDPQGRKSRNPTLWGSPKGWGCFRCEAQKTHKGDAKAEFKPRDPAAEMRDEERRRQYAASLIDQARFLRRGDIVDRYLRGRRLEPVGSEWPTDLRFTSLQHPETTDPRTHRGAPWPCMIAVVRDISGSIVAAHRTYLDPGGIQLDESGRPIPPGGKAPVNQPRMSIGVLSGNAVWLGEVHSTLVLAEGIESALAASHQVQEPAWSCLNAKGLGDVAIPKTVKRLLVAYDRDDPGRKALYRLNARVEQTRPDIKISIVPLPRPGARDPADLFG